MRVSVNGKVFEDSVCKMQLQRISQELPGISEKDAKQKVADEIIKHILLQEYANREIKSVSTSAIENQLKHIKASYPSEVEFKEMLVVNGINEEIIKKNIADDLKISSFIQKLTKNIPPAPQKVIEEFYKREYRASLKPKEIHAAHIVKKITQNSAEKVYREMCSIRKKLLEGEDFKTMADKYSTCNDEGGDLGWFSRGKMVEEFDIILFSMKPGEISPVFQTHFGYHIATVYEEKPEERMSLSECKDDLKILIHGRMVTEFINKWLNEVKPKAKIEIEF